MFNIRAFFGLSYYTSELDQFLHNFDAEHPEPSASQRAASATYQKIYALRDAPQQQAPKTSFWDAF